MQKIRKTNRKTLILIIIWITLFTVSMIFLETLAIYFDNNQSQSLASSIWSGYVVSSNLGNPQPYVTGIRASWIVPNAFPTSIDTY